MFGDISKIDINNEKGTINMNIILMMILNKLNGI